MKKSTQNDWKKKFHGWAFDHDRRYFKSAEGKRLMSMISKFLTDARREVIEKVEKELEGLDCGFCNYEKEVKERLATLREEEGAVPRGGTYHKSSRVAIKYAIELYE